MPANSTPRTGSTAKPRSRIGLRPQLSARRPTQGEMAAVTACGATIQAAITNDASLPARLVTIPAAMGSIAALASWNRLAHAAKTSNLRSVRKRHDQVVLSALGGAA